MKIGEAAERLGISPSTIRFYEKKGLIQPPERVAGQRVFTDSTLTILRFVRLSQAAGFTIGEIRTLLEQYANNPTRTGLWRPAAKVKRQSLSAQIEALKQMDAVLAELVECRCDSIEQCIRLAVCDPRWEPKVDG